MSGGATDPRPHASLSRRDFLHLAAGGVVASTWASPSAARPATAPRIRAVAFDAFPIFDPRPVFALAEALFPGKGSDLSSLWRSRQFEYQWLRTISGHYADFLRTTEDALEFAARMLHIDLTSEKRAQLMRTYLDLKAWPDAPPAIAALRQAGVRLAFLSNATERMLATGLRNAGLEGQFEHLLSADRVGRHKPDPRAYQMALDAFGLPREEIVFAAFAGWDAAGAKWFGYPTFWVNRLDSSAEELGTVPDATGPGLEELVRFVNGRL